MQSKSQLKSSWTKTLDLRIKILVIEINFEFTMFHIKTSGNMESEKKKTKKNLSRQIQASQDTSGELAEGWQQATGIIAALTIL
jgi:hypothetical protein